MEVSSFSGSTGNSPVGPTRVGPYDLGRVLGVGGFGRVLLGTNVKDGKQVAVKVINKDLVQQHHLEQYVQRETEMMAKIRHPHIVALHKVIETRDSYLLVLELARNGELFDKIVESKRFDEKTARKYFQQLISAVSYCHRKGIVHRDLKAENLLLGAHNELKVCDFGLSRYNNDYTKHKQVDHPIMFTSIAGSTDYQSPEMLEQKGYDGERSDIWSCGVILAFMITGHLPFAATTEARTRERIRQGAYRLSVEPSKECKDLLEKILVVDGNKRATIDSIVAHPWFQVNLDGKLFPNFRFTSPAPPVSPINMDGGSPGEFMVCTRTHNNPNSPTHPNEGKGDGGEDSLLVTLKRAFRSVNVDGSGFITRDQIRDVLIKLDKTRCPTPQEIDSIMQWFDREGDGHVSESEFIFGWTQYKSNNPDSKLELGRLVDIFHYDLELELLKDLRLAFDSLDLTHSGFITKEQLMTIPSLKLTDDDATQLLKVMSNDEGDPSPTVTFEDFVSCCTKTDILRNHPIGRRLQRVGAMFDVVEHQSGLDTLHTGFTVAGFRDTIANRLKQRGHEMGFDIISQDMAGYLHAKYQDERKRQIEVGIQLVPACNGYTKVMAYRISGRTDIFHVWYAVLRRALHAEIVQCSEDTSLVGEPELL